MNNQEVLTQEVVQEDTPVVVTPFEKWRKVFYLLLMILTFGFAIFAFYGFSNGLVATDRVVMSTNGLTEFLNGFITYIDQTENISTYYMIPAIFTIMYALVYSVYSIIFVISIIMIIISFIKNLFSKEDIKIRYSKVSKRALIFASLPLAFVCATYLFEDAALTSLGKTYVILLGILFVVSYFGNKLFNIFGQEEKNWVEFGLDSGKFVVLSIVIVLICSSFKRMNMTGFLSDMMVLTSNAANPSLDVILGLSVSALQIFLILQACRIIRAFIRFYPLNNGKKEVNALMRKRTIFLIIYTVLVYAVAIYAGIDDITGAIFAHKDTLLLLLLCSIAILCSLEHTQNNKEKNVIRN